MPTAVVRCTHRCGARLNTSLDPWRLHGTRVQLHVHPHTGATGLLSHAAEVKLRGPPHLNFWARGELWSECVACGCVGDTYAVDDEIDLDALRKSIA